MGAAVMGGTMNIRVQPALEVTDTSSTRAAEAGVGGQPPGDMTSGLGPGYGWRQSPPGKRARLSSRLPGRQVVPRTTQGPWAARPVALSHPGSESVHPGVSPGSW